MKKHFFLKTLPFVYCELNNPSIALLLSVQLHRANPAQNPVSALSNPVGTRCCKTQLFATHKSFNTRPPVEAQETNILLLLWTHISWQELGIARAPTKTGKILALLDGDAKERPQHEQSQGEGLPSPLHPTAGVVLPWGLPKQTAKRTAPKEASSQPSLQLFVLHRVQVLETPSLPSTPHRHLGHVTCNSTKTFCLLRHDHHFCFLWNVSDLICASHFINSLRHLIFNLSVFWLLHAFPSPFIPPLQALQCTSSTHGQPDQDICR